MCGEFGEVTVIIGLVINFLAFFSPLCAFRDTSTYVLQEAVGKKSVYPFKVLCSQSSSESCLYLMCERKIRKP